MLGAAGIIGPEILGAMGAIPEATRERPARAAADPAAPPVCSCHQRPAKSLPKVTLPPCQGD
jgi:hypothetical protein